MEIVTITRDYYDLLLNDSLECKMLYNAIFNNAGLAWNGKGLKVSDDDLNPILKALYPDEYETKIKALKRQSEAKEGENGAD